MQLHDVAFGSLRRRRGRFIFVLAALILGIGTVVALTSLSRAMRSDVSDELDRFGANIIVTPKATTLALEYGGMDVGGLTVDARELHMEDATLIRTIPNKRNISAVAPKLIGTTTIGSARLLLIGAKFDQEPGIKSWWKVEGCLPKQANEALLGSEAAQLTGKRPGDQVTIGGRSLNITGVLAQTGSIDDQAVFADLGLVQQTLGRPNAISLIEVSALCRGCPIDDIVKQIGSVLPHARVAPIMQAVAAREQAVLQMTRFGYAVSVVVLLVGALVIMTTMMASVTERTQEIGILRAVGFRRSHVAGIILIEAGAVSALGGLLGWLAGVAGARAFGASIAHLSTAVTIDPRLAIGAVVVATAVGVCSSIYPAIKAAQLDPAQALRYM
jgi:putative ABC transport system permease protein